MLITNGSCGCFINNIKQLGSVDPESWFQVGDFLWDVWLMLWFEQHWF